MFGRKKEIKIGQGFINGMPLASSRTETVKQVLKEQLKNYGRQLKSTYLTPLQKKDMKVEMEKLNRKLKELEKEKKYYTKKDKIRKTKEEIRRLKGGNSTLKKVDNYAAYFKPVPDMLGKIGTGNTGTTKIKLPGGEPTGRTKLYLPGPEKVRKYF